MLGTPGTLVMVQPGAAHSFANGGHERVVMMTTFISDLYVQYFRDVSTMRGCPGRRTARLVSRQHRAVLAGS